MASTDSISYFVLKCYHLDGLSKCIRSGKWACRDHVSPPHPRDLLGDAHREGRVILIFSVNNQHGWHGFCESLLTPENLVSWKKQSQDYCENTLQTTGNSAENCGKPEENDKCGECVHEKNCDNGSVDSSVEASASWYYFPLKWIKHFQMFNKQMCLGFEKTQHLSLPDGCPLNKARNWQKLTAEVGKELCTLIEQYHQELTLQKQRKEEEKLVLREESYFKEHESAVMSEADTGWAAVSAKVEKELGKVHLICPFGSQRYNCCLPSSDSDIFIVYQASTVQMLGLDPPKMTLKNNDKELVDYTVLELQRYCELLVAGDPKCIETLFLIDTSAVFSASPEWRQLCALRECLLTSSCYNKYMKEAQGTTGLKQLEKWRINNPGIEEMTTRLNKLGYIVLRLLQNARDLVCAHTLTVFRGDESQERAELLTVRQGNFMYSQLTSVIERYLREIETHKESVQPDTAETKTKIQDWLLTCRMQDLQLHPRIGVQS